MAGRQRGAMALIVAFMSIVMIGVAAIVIDWGQGAWTKRSLQLAAEGGALAGAQELCAGGDAETIARQYAELNHPGHDIYDTSIVAIGIWDASTRTLDPDTSGNAIQVTTRRLLSEGNQVDTFFAHVIGTDHMDVQATAIALQPCGGGGGVRFFIDDEMIDSDIPVIEDLANDVGVDPLDVISDVDGDWWIDLYDHLSDRCGCTSGPGMQLTLPTGQGTDVGNNDAGLFETLPSFPFSNASSPSLVDFLNWAKDGNWPGGTAGSHSASWRGQTLGGDPDALLDPLLGVAPVWDDSRYPDFVSNDLLVSPVYSSDISNLWPGEQGVVAKDERRGLLAFRIVSIGSNPPGSVLPFITIEVANGADVDLGSLSAGGGGGGSGGIPLLVG